MVRKFKEGDYIEDSALYGDCIFRLFMNCQGGKQYWQEWQEIIYKNILESIASYIVISSPEVDTRSLRNLKLTCEQVV